jgi:hypothetical protein
MNKSIKKVLLSVESELRLKSIDLNWTNLLGRVMAVVNNQSGRGRYAETAFKAVFGQEYHQHIKCTVAEAHNCTTIDERLGISNDSRLEAVAQELCFVGKNDAAEKTDDNDDGEYWDDDESVSSTDENIRQECDSDADSSLNKIVHEVIHELVGGRYSDVDSTLQELVHETVEDVRGSIDNANIMTAEMRRTYQWGAMM